MPKNTSTLTLLSDDRVAAPVVELRLRPGTVLPGERLVPGLLADVQVLSGEIAVAVHGFDVDAAEGDHVMLTPDEAPALWNTGTDVAHVRATLRLPASLSDGEVTRAQIAIESLSALGSVRDRTARAGDAVLRAQLEDELGDLVDLVCPRRSAPRAVAA